MKNIRCCTYNINGFMSRRWDDNSQFYFQLICKAKKNQKKTGIDRDREKEKDCRKQIIVKNTWACIACNRSDGKSNRDKSKNSFSGWRSEVEKPHPRVFLSCDVQKSPSSSIRLFVEIKFEAHLSRVAFATMVTMLRFHRLDEPTFGWCTYILQSHVSLSQLLDAFSFFYKFFVPK